MKTLIRSIPWILAVFALASCGSTWHLKQAEKHLKKAEQLGASIRMDTVYVDKTVIVSETKFDTVFSILRATDTLTIIKDRMITKLKIDTLSKKVFVSVKCPADSIVVRVPVTVTKKIDADFPWGWIVLAFCAGAILGLFATRKL